MKQILVGQFDAALAMLEACIEKCPAAAWAAPVCNLTFSQAAFHVLFFTDCYLGHDTDAMRKQEFHIQNAAFFQDYEEAEDRPQTNHYEKTAVAAYLQHCRAKARNVINAETAESFAAPCGFHWLQFSRAELYLYNLRHMQHHAAQLSLRLRLDHGASISWVKSGAP